MISKMTPYWFPISITEQLTTKQKLNCNTNINWKQSQHFTLKNSISRICFPQKSIVLSAIWGGGGGIERKSKSCPIQTNSPPTIHLMKCQYVSKEGTMWELLYVNCNLGWFTFKRSKLKHLSCNTYGFNSNTN